MKDEKKKASSQVPSTYFSVMDIYWSDLTKTKQQDLIDAGVTDKYVLDDTVPLGEVDAYYITDADSLYDYYEYGGYGNYYGGNKGSTKIDYSKYNKTYTTYDSDAWAKRYDDSKLVLEDNIKLARKVYWLIVERMPEAPELPSDMYIGEIVDYLAGHYSTEDLNDFLDLSDTTELEHLALDIYEMFFAVKI